MVYSSPETLEWIYKNSIPLYSLILGKRNSLVELVATDKKIKSKFKNKTLQYPLLSILHLNSFISYSPMTFSKSSTGYNISFSKKKSSDDVKFMAIKNEIYGVVSMDEVRSMKITEKNDLELKPSSFLAVCLNCGCVINSYDELNSCSTVGYLFKLWSKKSCHHYIDQSNYCAKYKRVSKCVEDVWKVDCEERIYNDKFNKDCVTAFLTVDDDDANINTAVNTMISIAYTALCNCLPSYSYNIPEYIINNTEDDLAIPLIEQLNTIIINSSRGDVSRLSYDLFITESVSNI